MSDVIDSLLAGSLLSRKEESDSAGMSLKKSQEKEPDLISVQFFFPFLLGLSEVKYHWSKSGKGE